MLPLLLCLRGLRMTAYGLISVVLVLYLSARGLEPARVSLVLALTIAGDAALSLLLTTRADGWGRKRTLVVGAGLMTAGAGILAATGDPVVLALAATVGVVSPTGAEVGPFLAVEQACLAQITVPHRRTAVFAWYNVVGFTASGIGAVIGGLVSARLQADGWTALVSYQAVLGGYALAGLALAALALRLGRAVEVPREPPSPVGAPPPAPAFLGLRESRRTVGRLSALFAVDAFGGGFILQSWLAWWLHRRFDVGEAAIGSLFLATSVLSGLSALAAVPLARRIGLVATMVWTHLPSNVLLVLVPFMPTFPLAAAVLLLRHTLSQMDVPTRQSYVNAIVPAEERSAANGVTGTARQLAAAAAPLVGTLLPVAGPLPFLLAGGIKGAYDLALWQQFRSVRPPEERGGTRA